MKKQNFKLFCIIMIIGLFIFNCKGKPDPVAETDVFQSASQENIDVMVEFMDETILEAKHGHKTINPFLTLQYKMTFRRIMVFNCQIENNSEEPVVFKSKHVELTYGEKTDHAHNDNFIINYWEIYDDEEGIPDVDHRKKEATVKQYVIDELKTLEPGSKIQGYLVFMDRYPQHGDAVLNIPVFTTNDSLITTFEFPYTFNIYE